jgi:hypothetical protein
MMNVQTLNPEPSNPNPRFQAHAGELINEVDEEAKRRSQYGAAAEDYHGHNGEYMRSGCPVCHRLVMVMDQVRP